MGKIDYNKHIWEGWTVKDFIQSLQPTFDTIMRGNGWTKPFICKKDIKEWCKENQPYYKKHIPEVAKYFYSKAGL